MCLRLTACVWCVCTVIFGVTRTQPTRPRQGTYSCSPIPLSPRAYHSNEWTRRKKESFGMRANKGAEKTKIESVYLVTQDFVYIWNLSIYSFFFSFFVLFLLRCRGRHQAPLVCTEKTTEKKKWYRRATMKKRREKTKWRTNSQRKTQFSGFYARRMGTVLNFDAASFMISSKLCGHATCIWTRSRPENWQRWRPQRQNSWKWNSIYIST